MNGKNEIDTTTGKVGTVDMSDTGSDKPTSEGSEAREHREKRMQIVAAEIAEAEAEVSHKERDLQLAEHDYNKAVTAKVQLELQLEAMQRTKDAQKG